MPSQDGLPWALQGAGLHPSRSVGAGSSESVTGNGKAVSQGKQCGGEGYHSSLIPHGTAVRREVSDTGLFVGFFFFFPLELLREQRNLLLSTWIPQTWTAGREEGSSLLWQCCGQMPLILLVKATP